MVGAVQLTEIELWSIADAEMFVGMSGASVLVSSSVVPWTST